MGLYTGVLISP